MKSLWMNIITMYAFPGYLHDEGTCFLIAIGELNILYDYLKMHIYSVT